VPRGEPNGIRVATRSCNPPAKHTSLSPDRLQNESWAAPRHGRKLRRQIEALDVPNGSAFPERVIQSASFATLLKTLRMTDAFSRLSGPLFLTSWISVR